MRSGWFFSRSRQVELTSHGGRSGVVVEDEDVLGVRTRRIETLVASSLQGFLFFESPLDGQALAVRGKLRAQRRPPCRKRRAAAQAPDLARARARAADDETRKLDVGALHIKNVLLRTLHERLRLRMRRYGTDVDIQGVRARDRGGDIVRARELCCRSRSTR